MIKPSIIRASNKSKAKWVLVFFLCVYQIFLFYNITHENVLLQDSTEYLYSAESFNQSGNFYAGKDEVKKDYRLYSKRTPVYPLVLYGFQAMGISYNFVYFVQLFIGLFNILLGLFLIVKISGNGFFPMILYSIFVLFTPSQFIYSQFIMADLLLQTFIMLFSLSLVLFWNTQKIQWLFGALFFSVLAALTKPVFLLASFIVAILTVYFIFKLTARISLILLATLPFLVWFGISNNNKKLTGVFHYSSIGYINLLHYNTNLFLISSGNIKESKSLDPLMIVPESRMEFKNNYKEVNQRCFNLLISHFWAYSIYHSKGIIYFFLDPGRFDLYNFFRVENENSSGFLHEGTGIQKIIRVLKKQPGISIALILVFLFKFIKMVGFFGFLWKRKRIGVIWLGASIVFYIAILTGPLGASRFALPVELIIIAYASLFYFEIFSKSKYAKQVSVIE